MMVDWNELLRWTTLILMAVVFLGLTAAILVKVLRLHFEALAAERNRRRYWLMMGPALDAQEADASARARSEKPTRK